MSSTLQVASLLVVGFSLGFLATFTFMVIPLMNTNRKLRKAIIEGITNQIKLLKRALQIPDDSEPVLSPIQLNNDSK